MTTLEISLPPALEAAWQQAQLQGLGYAGGVSPIQAWQLVQQGQAVLVDVRSAEELAEALCQADALLYAAKGAGRDCVQAAMTAAKPVDDERAAIESVANTALSA